jgi:MoaA/NifB/PqqE/SkfB family radical SAM enzyme
MLNYKDIRRVHLEISTRCNAACPECPRNFRGVDIVDTYPICDMSLDQAKKIFTTSFLLQLDQILINGNYGDFITAHDGLEIVEYFLTVNPNIKIIISTNASGRPHIWRQLGELGVEVQFRIDGLADTHHLYRQYTNFELILENALKFIQAGGYAIWAMIKFDHNKHQISQAEILSKAMGFKRFELVDAGRDTTVVFTRDKQLSHVIGNYQGPTDYDLLYDQYQQYISNPDITLKKVQIQERTIKCYSKENKEVYVSANGEIYPCCWLGFYPLSKQGNPSTFQLRPLIKENNALEYSIEHAIAWFNQIESTWSKTVLDGKIYTCNETCGSRAVS